jgi:hypothetical protein
MATHPNPPASPPTSAPAPAAPLDPVRPARPAHPRGDARVHRQRHAALHDALDELLACFLATHPRATLAQTPVLELLAWSALQTQPEGHDDGAD